MLNSREVVIDVTFSLCSHRVNQNTSLNSVSLSAISVSTRSTKVAETNVSLSFGAEGLLLYPMVKSFLRYGFNKTKEIEKLKKERENKIFTVFIKPALFRLVRATSKTPGFGK